ncbi:helix-turn-helix domain-containing protein, partial [Pseudomonas aeruginosa]|uniref:helix-turn-helix domain-containing protein n=1 Tax=Pseudomonas aeruginosa TaxID=287 RepID=UPI0040384399
MEYIKLSYHHLNFEDRTALMLESRKEGFSARKFAELIKRHPSTIYHMLWLDGVYVEATELPRRELRLHRAR